MVLEDVAPLVKTIKEAADQLAHLCNQLEADNKALHEKLAGFHKLKEILSDL